MRQDVGSRAATQPTCLPEEHTPDVCHPRGPAELDALRKRGSTPTAGPLDARLRGHDAGWGHSHLCAPASPDPSHLRSRAVWLLTRGGKALLFRVLLGPTPAIQGSGGRSERWSAAEIPPASRDSEHPAFAQHSEARGDTAGSVPGLGSGASQCIQLCWAGGSQERVFNVSCR
jgi:hypothetical protein